MKEIRDYIGKNNIAIHCESKEQWEEIVNLINKDKSNKVQTTTSYLEEKRDSLNLKITDQYIGCATKKHFEEHNYTIYPASDFIVEKVFGIYNIGDIVVSLTEVTCRRSVGDMFKVLKDSSKKTLQYKSDANNSESNNWRLATVEEKLAYEKGIKNISDIKDNLLEEATQQEISTEVENKVHEIFFYDNFNIGDYVVITQEISEFGMFGKIISNRNRHPNDPYWNIEGLKGRYTSQQMRKATEQEILSKKVIETFPEFKSKITIPKIAKKEVSLETIKIEKPFELNLNLTINKPKQIKLITL